MVSWYEAARYCNWMTSGNVDAGAYQFNESGTLTNVITRAQILADGGLFYVLPTEDEWYKAAYFKGDAYSLYANGMGTAPIAGIDANYKFAVSSGIWTIGSGTAEQNGTYDMNGNVWEWNESAWDGTLDNLSESRLARGGSFGNSEPLLSSSIRISNNDPSFEHYTLGFRVVAVPEPASAMMMVFGAGVGIAVHRARRNAMRR
jgi:formylglycine-generating enzyme required for sulfatase activity